MAPSSPGQCCRGNVERVYVHEKVYDDFVDGLVALTKTYVLGDPTDPATTLGPMAPRRGDGRASPRRCGPAPLPTSIRSCSRLIATARPISRGRCWTSVNHQMAFMTEETFGLGGWHHEGARRYRGGGPDERPKYGLTCSLWTEDLDAAEAIGRELHFNCSPTAATISIPR